ncbi:MAG: c-type cytochrome [Cytophagaceae bacterium]
MENKQNSITISLLISTLILAGCAGYRQTEPVMRPLSLNNETSHGQMVFMKNCQHCHPQGEAGIGYPFPQFPLPGFVYKARVRYRATMLGLGKMPSFKEDKISKEELNHLVSYIKAMRKNNNRWTEN